MTTFTKPTLVTFPSKTLVVKANNVKAGSLISRTSIHALTKKLAISSITPVKLVSFLPFSNAKAVTPEKSRQLKPTFNLIRAARLRHFITIKHRMRNRRALLRELRQQPREFFTRSIVLSRSFRFASTVYVHSVENVKQQTRIFFSKSIKRLRPTVTRVDKAFSSRPFYGYRKHRLGLGQFHPYIKVIRRCRPLLVRKVSKTLLAVYKKPLCSPLFQASTFNFYNLNRRLYSSTSFKNTQKHPFKGSKISRKSFSEKKVRISRLKKTKSLQRTKQRRLKGRKRIFHGLCKKAKKSVKKLVFRNLSSKKLLFQLAKKIRRKLVRTQSRRKLFVRNRRAYRSRKGWKRNRLHRAFAQKILQNTLQTRHYSKTRVSVRKNLLSTTYLKASFQYLTAFQKKLEFNSLSYTKYTPRLSEEKGSRVYTYWKNLARRGRFQKRQSRLRLFKNIFFRPLALRKLRRVSKRLSKILKYSAFLSKTQKYSSSRGDSDLFLKGLLKSHTSGKAQRSVAFKKPRKLKCSYFGRTGTSLLQHFNYVAALPPSSYFTNTFYKRSLLRRRVRGASLLRRRISLKPSAPLVLPTLFEIGQKRPRYPKHIYWGRRKSEKKVLNHLCSRAYESASKVPLTFIPKPGTVRARFVSLKNKRYLDFFSRLPRFTPAYRLLFRRWHSRRNYLGEPIARIWPSQAEVRRRARMNLIRFRRGLPPKKVQDPVFYELEQETGSSSSIGYRRVRRTLQTKFNTARWWKATALPSPIYHPAGVSFLKNNLPRSSQLSSKNASVSTANMLSILKIAKCTGLQHAANWNAYLPHHHVSENNAWRSIEGTLLRDPHSTNRLRVCRQQQTDAIFRRLESSSFSTLWSRCAFIIGEKGAQRLRKNFIDASPKWLASRYFEKKIQNQFLNYGNNISAVQARTAIFLNRDQLFKKFPNWWVDESYRRLHAIETTVAFLESNLNSTDKATLPWRLMSVLKHQVYGETSAYTVSALQTERAVLTSVIPFFPLFDKSGLIRDLFLGTESRLNLTDKSMSTPYQSWLRGIEGHMKKIITARSSQDHADSRKHNITLLGTDLPRFPGIGRRKTTYDASVRAFYKKTISARFNRVQSLRFRRLRPRMSVNFYSRLPAFESSSRERHSFRVNGAFSRARYYSRQWRKLLISRKLLQVSKLSVTRSLRQASTSVSTFKRRLVSSPAELLFSDAAEEQKSGLLQNSALEATSEALLLSALSIRAKNRQLQELVLHSGRRLLPLEQILPPWMAAGKARRQRKANRSNKADYMLPGFYEPMHNSYWVTSGFSMSVPQQFQARDVSLGITGETLIEPATVYKIKGYPRGWRLERGKRKTERFHTRMRRYKGMVFRKPKKRIRNPRYQFKAKRWYRNVRKSRKAVSRSWRGLKQLTAYRMFKKYTVAPAKFSYRLTHFSGASAVLAPLHFFKKTREIVISEQEKTRQKEGMALRRQEHYKKTTQLAENFTVLFPQLISLLLERQNYKAPMTRKEMRAAVHSAYWSVRYFLQSDRTGNRLAARDISQPQFNLLRNQLVRDTEDRYFDLADLKTIRYRFQPHKLNYSRRLNRGAIDWLRMFFPRYHSLYLEDPEVYKNFFLSHIKAFRAHPSRKNPGKWQTNKIPGLMQNRFKRLINPNDLQNSSRFESLLMTSRRSPVIVGHGAASRLKSVNFSGSLSPKGSFFNRQYSTRALLNATHSQDLISSRVMAVRRHISDPINTVSDVVAVSRRYTLKARVYARGRSNYALGRDELGAGFLDPRLSRAKSPRNLQFLQRVSLENTVASTFKRKLIKDSIYNRLVPVDKLLEQSPLYRSKRAARSRVLSSSFSEINPVALSKFRKEVLNRRIPSLLNSRLTKLRGALVPFVEKRLFTKRNRAQLFYRKKLKVSVSSFKSVKTPEELVTNLRSILSYRRAHHRSSHLFYTKSLYVPYRAVILKRNIKSFLNHYNLKTRLARNVFKTRRRRATSWYQRKSLKLLTEKLGKTTSRTQLRSPKICIRPSLAQRRVSALPLKYRFLNFLPFLKKASNSCVYRPRVKFRSQARRLNYNKKNISDFIATQEHLALENPEATGRQELWDAITLRWMKKHRVLKNWLKDAKRGLKKYNWDLMPELIFKGMRSRLRKLEWREPDEHFNRPGFRNAFRFFPGERRKAPWLEKLMYRRALYSTIRGSYRRYQFPREQKRLKWLQQYRKAIFPSRRSAKYLKRRRWPKLRIYNQRLFRGLFSLRNKRVAQKHFQKLSRRKPIDSGFAKSLTGLGDRLDVNLVLLNIAPTIFWAKILAAFGLFRVNSEIVKDPGFRFKKNDRIYWNWVQIERLRICFKPVLQRYETERQRSTSAQFPKNFEYFPGIRTAIYRRLPTPEDLPKGSRLSPFLFRMFKADSGSGK